VPQSQDGLDPRDQLRVATLGYLGTFTGPALIGYLAHRSDLATALLLPAVAVAATAVAAPAVRRT
jgi:hypothetical protein